MGLHLIALCLFFAAGLLIAIVVLNRWLLSIPDRIYKLPLVLIALALLDFGPVVAAALFDLDNWWPAPFIAVCGLVACGIVSARRRRQIAVTDSLVSVRWRFGERPRAITTRQLAIMEYRITAPHPALRGLRVGHVSDFHLDRNLPPEYYRDAIETLDREGVDLIVLAGDFVTRKRYAEEVQYTIPHVSAHYGIVAGLGNHDLWTDPQGVIEALTSAGARYLGDDVEEHARDDGGSFFVANVEHPWRGPRPPFTHLPAGMESRTLVISHTPDNSYVLAERGVAAIFAGHCHGGHIRIPGIGPLIVPSRYGRRFDRGHFRLGNTHLFLSAGLGAVVPPFRVCCPPDALLIEFA